MRGLNEYITYRSIRRTCFCSILSAIDLFVKEVYYLFGQSIAFEKRRGRERREREIDFYEQSWRATKGFARVQAMSVAGKT